ncbi:MAG TPA: organomercurial lyase [Thermoanaerobaculia bacterium]|jgi:hypothetical protein
MSESLARDVRLYVFRQTAETGRVPQPPQIAAGLGASAADVAGALKELAAGKVLILAPNDGNIWAANPFCAVPSAFQVVTRDRTYSAICIYDALGIPAALGMDGAIRTVCGDCGETLSLEVRAGRLARSEGILHFGVPAHHWWDNIGFT